MDSEDWYSPSQLAHKVKNWTPPHEYHQSVLDGHYTKHVSSQELIKRNKPNFTICILIVWAYASVGKTIYTNITTDHKKTQGFLKPNNSRVRSCNIQYIQENFWKKSYGWWKFSIEENDPDAKKQRNV